MKIHLLISLTILLAACGGNGEQPSQIQETATATAGFIKNVNAAEFRQLAEAGKGIILDIRTPGEIAEGHLANASIVDFYDEAFREKINLIDKEKEIYVYCKAGGRSAEAAKMLQQSGFEKVYNLKGGIMEWEQAGYPLTESQILPDENIHQMSLEEFNNLLTSDPVVLIDFHTTWCAPCRKMAPVIDKIEADFVNQAVVKRIDVDKSKEIGKAYNVKGVPVFILFQNGVQQWRHTGMVSEDDLTAKIREFL